MMTEYTLLKFHLVELYLGNSRTIFRNKVFVVATIMRFPSVEKHEDLDVSSSLMSYFRLCISEKCLSCLISKQTKKKKKKKGSLRIQTFLVTLYFFVSGLAPYNLNILPILVTFWKIQICFLFYEIKSPTLMRASWN